MNSVQLPTWLMERATPTTKGLQIPADVGRKESGGRKRNKVLVSFKEKDT